MVVEHQLDHNPTALPAHREQTKELCLWQAWLAKGVQPNYL
jgi:hypothetical protein